MGDSSLNPLQQFQAGYPGAQNMSFQPNFGGVYGQLSSPIGLSFGYNTSSGFYGEFQGRDTQCAISGWTTPPHRRQAAPPLLHFVTALRVTAPRRRGVSPCEHSLGVIARERSDEAIQTKRLRYPQGWMASSLRSLAMTVELRDVMRIARSFQLGSIGLRRLDIGVDPKSETRDIMVTRLQRR